MLRKYLAPLLLSGALLLTLAGCGPSTTSERSASGRVLTNAELQQAVVLSGVGFAFLPDLGYAEVSREALPALYKAFRDDLFAKGVVGWEGRFDCNKFAAALASSVQLHYYREAFHSRVETQAIAIGELWYLQGGIPGRGHAINIIVTNQGVIFFEPQSGQEVRLSAAEKASVFYCRI